MPGGRGGQMWQIEGKAITDQEDTWELGCCSISDPEEHISILVPVCVCEGVECVSSLIGEYSIVNDRWVGHLVQFAHLTSSVDKKVGNGDNNQQKWTNGQN